MGKINKISIKNYRNFQKCEINFTQKCNILYGINGSGKTNILESISLIDKGRGFRNANIINLNYKNTNNFELDFEYEIDKNLHIIKIFNKKINENFRKIISINDDASKESLEFIYSKISPRAKNTCLPLFFVIFYFPFIFIIFSSLLSIQPMLTSSFWH